MCRCKLLALALAAALFGGGVHSGLNLGSGLFGGLDGLLHNRGSSLDSFLDDRLSGLDGLCDDRPSSYLSRLASSFGIV
jgi:hypothetical protein